MGMNYDPAVLEFSMLRLSDFGFRHGHYKLIAIIQLHRLQYSAYQTGFKGQGLSKEDFFPSFPFFFNHLMNFDAGQLFTWCIFHI